MFDIKVYLLREVLQARLKARYCAFCQYEEASVVTVEKEFMLEFKDMLRELSSFEIVFVLFGLDLMKEEKDV